MSATDADREAIGLLQELGLKEYEAKCFVGLSRTSQATAKELGDLTDVPRTRVYDAIRVLEAKGLVEIQHGSPQRFRAVPIEEGLGTLEDQFDARLSALGETLRSVEPADTGEDDVDQEVWSLTGRTAVDNRTVQLVEDATTEVVLVVGSGAMVTDELVASLDAADDVTVVVGTLTPELEEEIRDHVPDATVFTSDLPWLQATAEGGGRRTIDRTHPADRPEHDHGEFGRRKRRQGTGRVQPRRRQRSGGDRPPHHGDGPRPRGGPGELMMDRERPGRARNS